MAKTKFMIAHGASVVVVRDGKRKTITVGAGDDFTEEEIASINRAVPGALRAPVNEGSGRKAAAAPADDADDDDSDETETTAKKAPAKKAGGKKAAGKKAAPVKQEKPADDDADDDDDADEDEDI
jgi:hypothetical protein